MTSSAVAAGDERLTQGPQQVLIFSILHDR